MAIITISLDDDLNNEFREVVRKKIGERKGAIGEALGEALKQWIHEKEQRQIADEMVKIMEKGFKMGKLKIKSRGELYDRK